MRTAAKAVEFGIDWNVDIESNALVPFRDIFSAAKVLAMSGPFWSVTKSGFEHKSRNT